MLIYLTEIAFLLYSINGVMELILGTQGFILILNLYTRNPHRVSKTAPSQGDVFLQFLKV